MSCFTSKREGCEKVVPIPIPSAIIVIAGMMAKMNEIKILATVYISKPLIAAQRLAILL